MSELPGEALVTLPPGGPQTRRSLLAPARLGGFAGVPRRWLLVGWALALGLGAEALYALLVHPWAPTFAAAVLFSLAALVVGGLFGFLFGMPYVDTTGGTPPAPAPAGANPPAVAGTGAAPAPAPGPPPPPSVTPSTHLQQIADWLTKLIIGAGLTQLGRIPSASGKLFGAMAPALGGKVSAPAVAGAVVLYFAGLGFVVGWLSTYFFLTPAMVKVEKNIGVAFERSTVLAAQADRAALAGRPERARQLRADSNAQALRAQSLLATYSSVYALPFHDPTRTARLDETVNELATAQLAAHPAADAVRALYDLGSRQREIALAMMAQDPSVADVEAVLSSIGNSRTAMEQYQALRAAQALLPGLPAADAARLRTVVTAETSGNGYITAGTSRMELAQAILNPPAPPI